MSDGRFHKVLNSCRFILLIILSVVLAEICVHFEVLNDLKTWRNCLKHIAIIIIYISAGLHSKKNILKLSKYFRIFITTHIFNFIIIPILIRLSMLVIGYIGEIDKWIVTGFIALGCVSPPLSSSVVLTMISNGNKLASVINAACGCLIGAILTPLLLIFHVGVSCILPVRATIFCVLAFGAAPIVFGYIIQYTRISNKLYYLTQTLANIAIFLLIFTSFYETFLETELVFSAHEVLITLVIVLLLQVLFMYLSIQFALMISSKQSDLNSEDLVSIMFGSVNKSLTIGLPLLKSLYGGYSHFSQISLPILMYYPVQFILGALVSPFAHSCIAGYIHRDIR